MIGPQSVAQIMDEVAVWYAVAGGWAVDLWLGDQTREHHDVEVAVLRSDQAVVHASLREHWDLYCIDPPGSGWRSWTGEPVELPAFQLQARSASIEFDLFTETSYQSVWTFRRDSRIQRPLAEIWTLSRSGVPIVRPEVQLLYMAKSGEPKNDHDFAMAGPLLDASARSWLAEALTVTQPMHPWLQQL